MLHSIGAALREARRDRGLSVDAVAAAAGISNAHVSRIERALAPRVPLMTLVKVAAVLGLDLSARLYPGGPPVRDAAHLALLAAFRQRLHRSVRWATEVPLPGPGDQRAWDALIDTPRWRYGVEAETSPRDAQALIRRIGLKRRDGHVDGVVLLVRDTRTVRQFLREAAVELAGSFPADGPTALRRLEAGDDPGGNAVLLLALRSAPRTVTGLTPHV